MKNKQWICPQLTEIHITETEKFNIEVPEDVYTSPTGYSIEAGPGS